jgi:hypothetical protein
MVGLAQQKSGGEGATPAHPKEPIMIWTIVVILVVLWLLGLTANIAGGAIHILLVLALVVLAINFLQGRRSIG